MDTVCPTIAELPDELRHFLPLPQWAACHLTLRNRPAGAADGYAKLLANIETIGLANQAEKALLENLRKEPTRTDSDFADFAPSKPCTS